ncbi:MAG: hypothetical protein ABIE94_00915 [archaeon]
METRSKWKYLVFLVVGLFFSLPSVFAAENPWMNWDLVDIFERLFRGLFNVFQNDYIMYGILVIMMFMLLYAVFRATLSRLKAFSGQDRQVKIMAFSMSAICCMGFFWYAVAKGGVKEVLTRFLTTFGLFGGIVVGAVVFMVVYFGLGDSDNKRWNWAMMAAGLGMLLVGSLISWPSIFGLGWALVLIGALFMLFRMGGGDGDGSLGGGGSGGRGGGGSGDGGRSSGGSGDGGGSGSGSDGGYADGRSGSDGSTKRPLWRSGVSPTATVRFKVEDERGNGLEGAKIQMVSQNFKWKSPIWATDEDGYYPSEKHDPATVPAGAMKITVKKTDFHWQFSFLDRQKVKSQGDWVLPAGKFTPIVIQMSIREAKAFKVHIFPPEEKPDHWVVEAIIR